MISRWGFQSEKHYIQTEDGYILLINRAYIGNSVGKVPIVLGHGISSNSNIFTDRGNKSLGKVKLNKDYVSGLNFFF